MNSVSKIARSFLICLLGTGLIACQENADPKVQGTELSLGRALFFDKNLSLNRTQACATCHDPLYAFADGRKNVASNVLAGSIGDDGLSVGDRNAPSAAYARFSPRFTQGSRQRFNSRAGDYQGYLGGQFWDGRAADLSAQAGGPPLNPGEMGMADETAVVSRIKNNDHYLALFQKLYGDDIFNNDKKAYAAMSDAIAVFERSDELSPFDSKYDRYLRDEATLSFAENSGKALFFSTQFTNCASCHQLKSNSAAQELFTGFEYHNIGLPKNSDLRLKNGKTENFIDHGLLEQANISDTAQDGKFKTPTLRNVAISAPYMHNGLFNKLSTVLAFYDHYHANSEHRINPETGLSWAVPEVTNTVNLPLLEQGRRLSENDLTVLECFLRTLTDQRYETQMIDMPICD